LIQAKLITRETISGCSEEEIESLEEHYSICLPESYKEFLRIMGKQAGIFFEDSDFLYPDLFGMREKSEKIWKDVRPFVPFGEKEFVFADRLGEQFLYFNAARGEETPVYHYLEMEEQPEKVAENFAQWFDECVDDEIELHHS
jgi:hypothetical protein